MPRHPHLVVSISGHGFGHVAQTAPVLNALHQLLPELRLTLRSAVPSAHLRSRIHVPFEQLPSEGDLGMAMSSALDVCVTESCAAYRMFHAEWEARIAAEARLLRELGADLVFSNVGYLPLAGAQQAGITNAALSSLNWHDIFRHYCCADKSADTTWMENATIAEQIGACYRNADAFLRATPGMAMGNLSNLVPVAPLATVGHNRRDELDRKLGLSREQKLVLVSMGGIASRLPLENWPRIDGVRWLVQRDWLAQHPDAIAFETLELSFPDLLASSDALLCKPGYGSFVEAACSGVPVLYVNRGDWPEADALVAWLQQYGLCREITRLQLEQGELAETLQQLWQTPHPEPAQPTGAEQAATWLAERLNG